MLSITGQAVLDDGARRASVVVEGGRIARVTADPVPGALDLEDAWIFPGLIDGHVHGGAGSDFMDAEAEAVRRVLAAHARGGTTGLLATTLTASPERILDALAAVDRVAAEEPSGARILGIHLEGPYLSPRRAGAQAPEHLRHPDLAEIEGWLSAAPGRIRRVTLAPELPGAQAAVERLVAAGVTASMGHTDADYAQARAGMSWGMRAATHTFDAMTPFLHRAPGVVGAVLESPELFAEVIVDFVHVHPAAVRVLAMSRPPDRCHLVTDAMRAAGLGPGAYRLGDYEVHVAGREARLADGTLAGSVLTMAQGALNLMELGLSPQAVRDMVSLGPARALGLEGRKGRLVPGHDGDLTVIARDGRVLMTVVGGRVVHRDAALAGAADGMD